MSALRHAPLPLALAGMAALFPLTAMLDRRRTPPPDIVQVLPPAALVPVLTFGHPSTAADVLEVRATNFLMSFIGRMNYMRHEHVTRLYDAILALDPRDAGAYRRAAVYQFSVAGRPDLAVLTLQRGLNAVPVEHPERWRLYAELAAIDIIGGLDLPEAERAERVRRAGKLLLDAEGVPAELKAIGRHMATRGLSPLESLEFEEQQVWIPRAQSGEPAMRARAKERLAETRAAIIVTALQLAADTFVERQGRAPQDLRELARFIASGLAQHEQHGLRPPAFLATLRDRGLADPLGYGFRLDGARVLAPALDGARLERHLEPTFLLWCQAHPGQTPTLADLGSPEVPPHLRVILGPGTLDVRPR